MIRTGNIIKEKKLNTNINLFKVILIIFLVGMIYGAFLISFSEQGVHEQFQFLTQRFVEKRSAQSVIYTFFGSLGSNLLILSLIFILGFCAIGQPFSLFLTLFQGLGLGASIAHLYSNSGMQGILFALAIIIPQAIITSITLFLACRESVRFSNKLFFQMIPNKFEVSMDGSLRMYIIRFLVLVVFNFVAAIVDTLCTFLFSGFFR